MLFEFSVWFISRKIKYCYFPFDVCQIVCFEHIFFKSTQKFGSSISKSRKFSLYLPHLAVSEKVIYDSFVPNPGTIYNLILLFSCKMKIDKIRIFLFNRIYEMNFVHQMCDIRYFALLKGLVDVTLNAEYRLTFIMGIKL